MLEQNELEAMAKAAGVSAKDVARDFELIIASFLDLRYIPLRERMSEFVEEPDKGAGFVLVGSDTWLPKHLVDARKHQHRKVSQMVETGIVWTR